ncbi:MAG: hypothetical protein LH615_00480 [Ferruginibacter sp.]|nr:hypothetical protein [Ferruginibacter sp.]
MKYLLLTVILFFSLHLFAQDCSDVLLLQTPGILKGDAPYNSGKLAAIDLAKHKKVVAAIITMIKLKITPMGLKALYHENYGMPSTLMPVNDYSYSIIPLNFYCDGNGIKTVGETPTYFSVTANRCGAEVYELVNNEEAISGTGFHYTSDMPIAKDGYWYFKEIETALVDGMLGTGKEYQWLITYDGKLPFAYVTKK